MLLVAAVLWLCARLLTFDIDVMCLFVSGPRTLPAAAGAAVAAPKSRFRVRHFAGVASIHVIAFMSVCAWVPRTRSSAMKARPPGLGQ